jgi:GNAT superfamily N-acetyltransferase
MNSSSTKLKIVVGKTVEQNSDLANIALKHRLFVSGWTLSGDLIGLRDRQYSQGTIAVGYIGDLPVAVSVADNNRVIKYLFIQAFVRKQFRGNGIGRAVAAKLIKSIRASDYTITTGDGITGSDKFWESVKNCVQK